MPNTSDKTKKRSTSFDVNPTFATAPFEEACTGACLRPHFFMEPSDISGASMCARRNVLMNAWENAVCVFVCMYLSVYLSVRLCICVYLCMCVCVFVCVCMCVCRCIVYKCDTHGPRGGQLFECTRAVGAPNSTRCHPVDEARKCATAKFGGTGSFWRPAWDASCP